MIQIMSKVIGVTAAVATVMVLVGGPASALGDNRTVERHCGKNYVSSGSFHNRDFWAQTQKQAGNCAGRLSVALEADNGIRSPRVYGDNKSAYIISTQTRYVRGLHWGCDECDVTKS